MGGGRGGHRGLGRCPSSAQGKIPLARSCGNSDQSMGDPRDLAACLCVFTFSGRARKTKLDLTSFIADAPAQRLQNLGKRNIFFSIHVSHRDREIRARVIDGEFLLLLRLRDPQARENAEAEEYGCGCRKAENARAIAHGLCGVADGLYPNLGAAISPNKTSTH